MEVGRGRDGTGANGAGEEGWEARGAGRLWEQRHILLSPDCPALPRDMQAHTCIHTLLSHATRVHLYSPHTACVIITQGL